MPLSRCPSCGFSCRVLWPESDAPNCPECEAQMSFIGRSAFDAKERPALLKRRYAKPYPRLSPTRHPLSH